MFVAPMDPSSMSELAIDVISSMGASESVEFDDGEVQKGYFHPFIQAGAAYIN